MYLSQWCNDNINKLNKHYTCINDFHLKRPKTGHNLT